MSFDVLLLLVYLLLNRLNPFRAGRCLSILLCLFVHYYLQRLNPFRSGQCLSTYISGKSGVGVGSQSLSIRAMSFDIMEFAILTKDGQSQSLSIRAMSFDV